MSGFGGQLETGMPIDGGTDGTAVGNIGDNLKVIEVIGTSAVYKALSVTTSATLAIVGGAVLANRKVLTVIPTNGTVYMGFSNSVTTATGTPIFKNQMTSIAVGPSITVYLIAGSTIDCRISEGS